MNKLSKDCMQIALIVSYTRCRQRRPSTHQQRTVSCKSLELERFLMIDCSLHLCDFVAYQVRSLHVCSVSHPPMDGAPIARQLFTSS